MVTVEDVRRLAIALPRTEEHLIRDRVKFRIGQIVYPALSRDEAILGFAFPKEERAALVASEPAKFSLPRTSELRYNWVEARLAQSARTHRTGHRGVAHVRPGEGGPRTSRTRPRAIPATGPANRPTAAVGRGVRRC